MSPLQRGCEAWKAQQVSVFDTELGNHVDGAARLLGWLAVKPESAGLRLRMPEGSKGRIQKQRGNRGRIEASLAQTFRPCGIRGRVGRNHRSNGLRVAINA
jgi:hypothetical protein